MRWQIVIPQKPLTRAKSRLERHGPVFAEAMLRDVIAACHTAGLPVSLLGNGDALESFGAPVLPDAGGGLSAAVDATARTIDGPLAVLMGDLPCVSADDLVGVLHTAEAVDFGVVADAEGTGTTLLAARRGGDLHSSYGAGSFTRHRALGAVDLLAGEVDRPGLRRDVDTLADLLTAAEIGVGPSTRAAMTHAGFDAVHLGAR